MLLKSLSLHNIRSYQNENISFSKGSTLLHGDVGSGKSTILHAIEFSLFGIRRGQLSGNALLRKGETSGSVVLEFSIDNKDIIIERTLKKMSNAVSAGPGAITINGNESDGTATELTSKVVELLGYPSETATKTNLIFRYSLYTPQADMQKILFETDDVRKDTIRKIFGIDKFHRIAKNAQIVLKHIKDQINNQSVRIEQKEALQREYVKLKDEISNLSGVDLVALERLERSLNQEENDLDSIKTEYTRIVQLKNIVENLRSNRSDTINRERGLKQEKDDVEKKLDLATIEKESLEISRVEMPSSIERRLNDLKDKLKDEELSKRDAQREYAACIKEETSCKELIERIDKAIEKEQAQIKQIHETRKEVIDTGLDKKVETMQSQLKEIQARRAVIEEQIKSNEESFSNFSKLKTCPTCFQEVSLDHKDHITKEKENYIQKRKEELNELSTIERKISSNVRELLIRLTSLQKEIDKLEFFEQTRAQKMSEKHGLQSKLERLAFSKNQLSTRMTQDDNTKLKEAIFALEKQLEDSRAMQTKQARLDLLLEREKELAQRLNSINADLSQIFQSLQKYDSQVKEYQTQVQKLTDISLNLARKETKVNDLKSVLNIEREKKARRDEREEFLTEQLTNLNKKIDDLNQISRKVDLLTAKRDFLERELIPLQSKLEENTLLSLHAQCSSFFSSWFSKIMQSDLQAHLDDNFAPKIISQGHDLDIDYLSGGEKTAIALAYRLALNQIITTQIDSLKTQGVLILDEPTEGFSSAQLDQVREVLDELQVDQLILVSHEPKVESFCENIIKVDKIDGVSSVF